MDATAYGELMRRRALGLEPEMESAKQLVKILRPIYQPGMSVLDVGCGCGHFLRSLRRLDPHINYTGIDDNRGYLQTAMEIWPGLPFFRGNVQTTMTCPPHDIVVCVTVLQNLPDYKWSIREMLRLTGHALVMRLLLSDMTHWIVRDEPSGLVHYNIYSETEVVDYVNKLGIHHVEVLPDECNIELLRTDVTSTYTICTDEGKLLQANGCLILPWKWIRVTIGRE